MPTNTRLTRSQLVQLLRAPDVGALDRRVLATLPIERVINLTGGGPIEEPGTIGAAVYPERHAHLHGLGLAATHASAIGTPFFNIGPHDVTGPPPGWARQQDIDRLVSRLADDGLNIDPDICDPAALCATAENLCQLAHLLRIRWAEETGSVGFAS